jgi:hypothetical protein
MLQEVETKAKASVRETALSREVETKGKDSRQRNRPFTGYRETKAKASRQRNRHVTGSRDRLVSEKPPCHGR